MSGYLIVASYDRSSSLSNYLKKRARRILPAYWATLVFSLILGTAFSRISAVEFWKSLETWKYIFSNLSFANFLHPTLPGLFLHNPGQLTVNGALWTIKVEVMFYLLVPGIVVLCRRLGRWQVLSIIFFLSAVYRTACEGAGHPSLAMQLPGQLCYFAIGSLVYYYYPWFCKHGTWMWATAISSYLLYLAIDGIVLSGFLDPFGSPLFRVSFPSLSGSNQVRRFFLWNLCFSLPNRSNIDRVRSLPGISATGRDSCSLLSSDHFNSIMESHRTAISCKRNEPAEKYKVRTSSTILVRES